MTLFECPKCGARVWVQQYRGKVEPRCRHVPERQLDEKEPRRMEVVHGA